MEIEGKPVGKGRPRFYRGHAVTPKNTREYEKIVADTYKESKLPYFETEPVIVEILAKHPVPKSETKKNRIAMLSRKVLPTLKPDIDNIAKIILDGLNGVAFADDKQVVELKITKEYSTHGSVIVTVKEKKCDTMQDSDL